MKRLFEIWLDFIQKICFYLSINIDMKIFLPGGPISH